MSDELLQVTEHGLYCERGDFHIDPWKPVDRAIITHAHADHARPGSTQYLVSIEGETVSRDRLGARARIDTLAYGEAITMNDVRVSMHPAGHVIGSSQIRVEGPGVHGRNDVWVVTGDFKRDTDPTCTPFEPVPCDVFITESTFGLPIYRWDDPNAVFAQINEWWRINANQGVTSILFSYALGKSQRIMAGVDPTIGPILTHGAVSRLNRAYEAAGVRLPDWTHAAPDVIAEQRERALVIAPPSAGGSTWMRRFRPSSDAFASGWMRLRGTRRRRAVDRGFVLSDHADWPALLRTIRETGASRIGVTHGYTAPMVRWLTEREDLDAWVIPSRFQGEVDDEVARDDDDAARASRSSQATFIPDDEASP